MEPGGSRVRVASSIDRAEWRRYSPAIPVSQLRKCVHMKDPVFDIFSGTTDNDAVWLEAVAGLSSARDRMEEIAAQSPGQYFVFGQQDHSILARIDTRNSPLPSRWRKAVNRD